MIEKQGDLFTSDAPILGHGVNCKGLMGAGIAVQFRKRFPQMYEQYKMLCYRGFLQPGNTWLYPDVSGVTVANIASQFLPGADATWLWLYNGLKHLSIQVPAGTTIAIPLIGCGIGGLKKDDLLLAVNLVEQHNTVEFEVWTL